MKKIFAMTLSIIMTCAALTACGDTAQPSEESKAETTTTTAAAETTTTETTTETLAETEETTTTTTATETETTTTTEAAEETETETETEPQTEALAENPEETGIVTMEDNPDGMYPMKDAFIKVIEEHTNQKVVSIVDGYAYRTYDAILDNGDMYRLIPAGSSFESFDSDELTNINDYQIKESDSSDYRGIVLYIVPELF